MLTNASEKTIGRLLAFGSCAITLFVLTGTASDPVNCTKFLLLGGVSIATFFIFLTGGWKLIKDRRMIFVVSAVFIFASINAILNSNSPIQQNVYGTFGRNTGFLTYLFLLFIFIAATSLNSKKSFHAIIISLIVSGVINVIYSLYVLIFGDFVPWNNPYGNILGTFGNPNFIGAFLGFFTAALIAYALTTGVAVKIRIITGLFSLMSVYAIIRSQAIQGRVVFAAGIAIIGFYYIRSKFKGYLLLSIYSFGVMFAGVYALLGSLQIGPLTKYIYKTSVSLRGEYWLAGINMAKENLLTGIGFDSYGDWYRRSRDAQALILPGPDTVTNAAHNVPIDVFAFGGIPLLIPYLVLIAMVFNSIIRFTLKNKEYDGIFVALSTAWIGYQIQSIISINQIGLAIWGWLLGGAILAYTKCFSISSNIISKNKVSKYTKTKKEQIFSPQLIGALGMVLGLIVAYPPISADAKFQSALKSGNLANIEIALTSAYLTPTDTFRLLDAVQILEKNQIFDKSYAYAKKATVFNPECFDAWKLLYYVQNSTIEDKKLAKSKMIELDPLNAELKKIA